MNEKKTDHSITQREEERVKERGMLPLEKALLKTEILR